MNRTELLKYYGDTRVGDILGILHNYTKNDSYEEHVILEDTLKPYKSYTVRKALSHIEEILEFDQE